MKQRALVAALLIITAPAMAQSNPAGEAAVSLGLPHDVRLNVGANDVEVRVFAEVTCEDDNNAPPPLEVTIADAAPDDGNGPAWTYDKPKQSVPWVAVEGGYAIDETIAFPVTGHGYGTEGRGGEFTVRTAAVSDASCSIDGFQASARSSHAHVSIGPRSDGENASAPGMAVLIAGLALVAWRRR